MPLTAGYQAGIEANQTQLSYAPELTWGARPTTVAFSAIRYMSDTLGLTKTRQRPAEINVTREVSNAVTTEQVAGGSINYALSYGSFDDFFSSLMQNDWTPPYAIASIGADITMTSTGTTTLTLSSTLANKFASINVGQYIRISGFTQTLYNDFWRVTAKADPTHISVFGKAVGATTETSAGTNIKITGSTLNNGTTFKSLFVQQKFSSTKYLRYGGSYVSRITLGTSVGNFFTGTIDLIAQSEISATAEASTFGPTVPAPQGTVFNPVAGFIKLAYNNGTVTGLLDQLSMTLENTGAAPEFSLGGTAGADGILGGTFTASGAFRMYCKDFTLYQYFENETNADMQIYLQDGAKNSYVLSFQQVVLFCKINATGPGTAVFVDVTFEVNPDPTLSGTFQIDRNPTPN
jgi:hypothetical protein